MRVSLDLSCVVEANAPSAFSLFSAFVLVFFTCSMKVPIVSKVSQRIVGI